MELLWADGAGEEYSPLITTDMARTVLGVFPHTVVTVPITFWDGGELRLQGGGGRRGEEEGNNTLQCS